MPPLVAAYTPVCVEKFVGPADDAKWESSQGRVLAPDDYVKKAGLADLPHPTEPNNSVAKVRWCSHEIAGCARTEEVADNPVLCLLMGWPGRAPALQDVESCGGLASYCPARKELRNGSSKSDVNPPSAFPQVTGADYPFPAFRGTGAPFIALCLML